MKYPLFNSKIPAGFLGALLLWGTACFAPTQPQDTSSPEWELMNPPLEDYEEILAHQKNHRALVGVLDSGVDYTATALRRNIHLFPVPPVAGRAYGVGLDLLGGDLFPGPKIWDPELREDITAKYMHLEHGTHVAGLVGLGNPAIGIIPVRVMPIEDSAEDRAACAPDKQACSIRAVSRQIDLILKGIAFCAAHGARVINMSLGMAVDGFPKEIEQELLRKANLKLANYMNNRWRNILMVVAAGNEGRAMTAVTQSIPATLEVDQMLSVGALMNSRTIAEYSNSGRFVDIYINGSDVKSTVFKNQRDIMSGTSMAAPLIANLAAQLLLIDSTFTAPELRGIILNTAEVRTLQVESEEPGPKELRTVRVARFAAARNLARFLVTHPGQRAERTRPQFIHGQAN